MVSASILQLKNLFQSGFHGNILLSAFKLDLLALFKVTFELENEARTNNLDRTKDYENGSHFLIRSIAKLS